MQTAKYPPILDLSAQMRIISIAYNSNRIALSEDDLSEIMKVSKTSSYFIRSITALKQFDLLTKEGNNSYRITRYGLLIIQSVGNKYFQLLKTLLGKNEILKEFLTNYPDGNLPLEDKIIDELISKFEIRHVTIDIWYKFVTDSFQLLTSYNRTKENISISINDKLDLQKIRLPSNINFSFSFENDYTIQDIEFIIDFFEIIKKRLKSV